VTDRFNAEHPEGTRVRFWPGARWGDDGETELPAKKGLTRSAAWLLGGHTPVVMVTGQAGGVALTHVEVIPLSSMALSILNSLKGGGSSIFDARAHENALDELKGLGFIENVVNDTRAGRNSALWRITPEGAQHLKDNDR
jgi:hypothetical protein